MLFMHYICGKTFKHYKGKLGLYKFLHNNPYITSNDVTQGELWYNFGRIECVLEFKSFQTDMPQ